MATTQPTEWQPGVQIVIVHTELDQEVTADHPNDVYWAVVHAWYNKEQQDQPTINSLHDLDEVARRLDDGEGVDLEDYEHHIGDSLPLRFSLRYAPKAGL